MMFADTFVLVLQILTEYSKQSKVSKKIQTNQTSFVAKLNELVLENNIKFISCSLLFNFGLNL